MCFLWSPDVSLVCVRIPATQNLNSQLKMPVVLLVVAAPILKL